MHAELLSSLAAQHHRDLARSASRHRVTGASAAPPVAPVSPVRSRGRRALPSPVRSLPGLRISWSRTTLAAATAHGRGRSWVIVIAATRTR